MLKKTKKQKNKKTKKQKNKKTKRGGAACQEKSCSTIEPSDIMYQNDLVCILRPEIKKGIIIWTHYTQPSEMDSLCKLGIKTGLQLQKEGANFGRSIYHPHIFFRAPYYARDIDYSTPETEIISSYGERQIGIEPRVFIRVDPERTFVFSSEIRSEYLNEGYPKINRILENSKKSLSRYLTIINNNLTIEQNAIENTTKKILYNLFSSEARLFPSQSSPSKPFNIHPINRNSEILVSLPHLKPDFFVLCT